MDVNKSQEAISNTYTKTQIQVKLILMVKKEKTGKTNCNLLLKRMFNH